MPEYTSDLSGLENGMAAYEGYGVPDSVATRNNNPGNIKYGPFAIANGAVGNDNGFATFPDPGTGFSAMSTLLQSPSYSGLSIADALSKWNGGGSNSGAYTNFVTGKTGLSPMQPLSSLDTNPGGAILTGLIAGVTGVDLTGSKTVNAIGKGTDQTVATTANAVAAPFAWLSHVQLSQVVSILVGLGMVFAGFFMLKPTQNILISGAKSAAKLAA